MSNTTRPTPGPLRPWRFPEFTRTRADYGPEVLLCDVPSRRMAAAKLLFSGGTITEPSERRGVLSLAADVATQATLRLDGAKLATERERLGASLGVISGHDGVYFGLQCPPEMLEASLELMAEVVATPAFAPEAVERLRNQRLADLEMSASDPNGIATMVFPRIVCQDDSPYAVRANGTPESVAQIGRDDLVGSHAWLRDTVPAALAVAGPLDGRSPAEFAAPFASCSGRTPPSPPTAELRPTDGRILVVDQPGAPQSVLRLGHDGPTFGAEDQAALLVLELVLGGLQNSRLNLKLREGRGISYGVTAGFEQSVATGAFAVATSVQTDATAVAVDDIIAEIVRVQRNGITGEELIAARDAATSKASARFESAESIADGLAALVLHDLEDGFHDGFAARLGQVTQDDVAAVAQRVLKPDDLAILVVGDAAAIENDLAATGRLVVRYEL